jgi:hypothetical protein
VLNWGECGGGTALACAWGDRLALRCNTRGGGLPSRASARDEGFGGRDPLGASCLGYREHLGLSRCPNCSRGPKSTYSQKGNGTTHKKNLSNYPRDTLVSCSKEESLITHKKNLSNYSRDTLVTYSLIGGP